MLTLLVALTLSTPAAHACAEHANAAATPATRAVASADAKSYGQGVTLKETPMPLAEALKNIDSLKDKDVVVRAEVDQVCQDMGCWMTLKDKDANVRVTFKDYAFTIPKDSSKHHAVVQGRLINKELSPAEARVFAKKNGKSAKEVAAIKGPVKQPAFEATGLTLSKN